VAATFKCQVEVGALVTAARTHGVGVYDLGRYYAESPPPAGLVFGYCGIEEAAIRQGLSRLRELVPQAALAVTRQAWGASSVIEAENA